MRLFDKTNCPILLRNIADNQLAHSPNDNDAGAVRTYKQGIVDGLEMAYNAIQEWADKYLTEEAYMDIYKHGREDEAGLRDGTILQTFSPD